jgi:hypothetical protein
MSKFLHRLNDATLKVMDLIIDPTSWHVYVRRAFMLTFLISYPTWLIIATITVWIGTTATIICRPLDTWKDMWAK